MPHKASKYILITLGFALCMAGFLYLKHTPPVVPILSTSTTQSPIRLLIPKIGVDTAIESVGMTPDGAMEAPTTPEGAAWFNLGPHPGEQGSAVIAGHYGWKGGRAAVFDSLSKISVGDLVTVENTAGITDTFIVRKVRTYDAGMDATDIFVSQSGAHLNLITCIGAWNISKKSYAQRLVVFTDLVSSTSTLQ